MANIKITDLQGLIIEELDDETSIAVVGGASESGLLDLESQLEKLNPQTEIGKALLGALEGLVK
ncbi:hypothetical protein LC607_02020 [Nostoc sp. CHAB 5824]|nr:hypothetical protein [Nostoc sp. CHAB 5824]